MSDHLAKPFSYFRGKTTQTVNRAHLEKNTSQTARRDDYPGQPLANYEPSENKGFFKITPAREKLVPGISKKNDASLAQLNSLGKGHFYSLPSDEKRLHSTTVCKKKKNVPFEFNRRVDYVTVSHRRSRFFQDLKKVQNRSMDCSLKKLESVKNPATRLDCSKAQIVRSPR